MQLFSWTPLWYTCAHFCHIAWLSIQLQITNCCWIGSIYKGCIYHIVINVPTSKNFSEVKFVHCWINHVFQVFPRCFESHIDILASFLYQTVSRDLVEYSWWSTCQKRKQDLKLFLELNDCLLITDDCILKLQNFHWTLAAVGTNGQRPLSVFSTNWSNKVLSQLQFVKCAI